MNALTATTATTETNNPFAGGAVAVRPTTNAIAESGQQREIAEVQAAMVIAKRFPRDPIAAMDRVLQACTRPTLAEGALYSYSRGGQDVTGPSIRLAETLAQIWGNLQFGIRELEQRVGESTVEAFAWDIETNTRQIKVFQVGHVRHTKKGQYRLEDPRDVYEVVANQGARRLRACILGVIPGDVIEAAVKQCEETLKTHADTSPEAIKKIIAAFEPFGVSREQIEKRIQSRIEAIRPAQVVHLKKVYASLRDGMSSPADWFDGVETNTTEAGAATTALRDKLKGKAGATKPEPVPTSGGSVDTGTGEVTFSYDGVLLGIQNAGTLSELEEAADAIRELPNASQRQALSDAYTARKIEIERK